MRSIATCARSMGARIPRTTHVSVVGLKKDGKEKSDYRAARKGGKKGTPVNHNFAQLTKKIKKLEKVLKKSSKKGKKCRYKDSNSNSQ